MKSSKRKNASKSSTPEIKKPACDSDLCAFMTFIAIMAMVGVCVFGVMKLVEYATSPKFEVGNCLLNRVGETLEVSAILPYGEVYELLPQQYVEGYSDYVAIRDYDKPRVQKDIEFVDEKYIQVPCIR